MDDLNDVFGAKVQGCWRMAGYYGVSGGIKRVHRVPPPFFFLLRTRLLLQLTVKIKCWDFVACAA